MMNSWGATPKDFCGQWGEVMAEKTEFADGIYRLPIHFGVDVSRLPVRNVVTSLRSVTTIIRDIEKQLVGHNRKATEIYVVPVEEGSLKLVIAIVSGFILLTQCEESKNFEKFMSGMTGKEYEGGKIGDVLGEVGKALMETELPQIFEAKPGELNLDKAINAKCKFYKMLQGNGDIEYVCFNDDESGLIPRSQFQRHIAFSLEIPLGYREEYRTAIIASAVTIDKQHAKWGFINFEGWKEFKAYMEDYDFKRGFLYNSQYPLKEGFDPDTIYALFRIEQIEEGGVVKDGNKIHVMKVYRFNDIQIAEPPVKEREHSFSLQ